MYSGTGRLGEQQDEVQDQDERDVDFISANFYSPDPGYAPQRVNDYDTELVQHQTLNGTGISRAVGLGRPTWLQSAIGVTLRSRAGGPRGDGARFMRPRFTRL